METAVVGALTALAACGVVGMIALAFTSGGRRRKGSTGHMGHGEDDGGDGDEG